MAVVIPLNRFLAPVDDTVTARNYSHKSQVTRVQSMLAQTVADGKRHTELYEQSLGNQTFANLTFQTCRSAYCSL